MRYAAYAFATCGFKRCIGAADTTCQQSIPFAPLVEMHFRTPSDQLKDITRKFFPAVWKPYSIRQNERYRGKSKFVRGGKPAANGKVGSFSGA